MRGSISVLTSMLIALLLITSLITVFVTMYRELMSNYATSVKESTAMLREYSKDLEAELNNEGLILKTSTPPVNVIGILAIYNNGDYEVLKHDIYLNSSSMLALTYEEVNRVFSNGGEILVLASGGKYIVINSSTLNNTNEAKTVNDNELSKLISKDPYIISGLLLDKSFLNNPVPGTPDEPGSNYEPLVYVNLGKYSTGVLASTVKITYGGGYHTLYLYSKPQAFLLLIPILVNREEVDVSTATYAFHVFVRPINNYPSGDIFYLSVSMKPVIYVVLPEDFLRAYLVTKPGNIMYVGQFKNAVARTIYYKEGPTYSATLRAYRDYYKGNIYDTYERTLLVTIDSGDIFRSIPSFVDSIVILAGVQGIISYSFAYNLWSLSNPYAELRIGIYDIGHTISFTVPENLRNKPVFVNIPLPDVVPVIKSPSGRSVKLYRPTNVESSAYERLLWFEATEVGTYELKLTGGTLSSYSLKEVPVGGNLVCAIGIKSSSHVRRNYLVSRSEFKKYVVEPGSGSIITGCSFIHKFQGYVYWWWSKDIGPDVIYGGVPSTAYYRVSVDDCRDVSWGWYRVTYDLYKYGYLYAYGKCRSYLILRTDYYPNSNEFKFWSRLNVYTSDYVTYTVEIKDEKVIGLKIKYYDGVKLYYSGNTIYVGLLDLSNHYHTIFTSR